VHVFNSAQYKAAKTGEAGRFFVSRIPYLNNYELFYWVYC